MEVGKERAGAVGGAWEGEGWAGGRGGETMDQCGGSEKNLSVRMDVSSTCQNARIIYLSK